MPLSRSRPLNALPAGAGPILYYVQRDQRATDNWALLTARAMAERAGTSVQVVFSLSPTFAGGTFRQYHFMLAGLRELERSLIEIGIPFHLLIGDPGETLPTFAHRVGAGAIVVDFNPIRPPRTWKETWKRYLDIPLVEVDAHNVVPAWLASDKREYGAYTLRPKLRKLLPNYLTDIPKLTPQAWKAPWPENDWDAAEASLKCDRSIGPVNWIVPGERAAKESLRRFIRESLNGYAERRRYPDVPDGQSDLSPYFHFGQLAPQRAALAVQSAEAPEVDKASFLEEIVVRRELSDNFCLYTDEYDSLASALAWARNSLVAHVGDERAFLYSLDELEAAMTHDPLWNAAQTEMVMRGKMHNYMRMYWAKKILEWSPDAAEALRRTVYLNDRYFLDGRDPNGYAGALWAVAGLHDRPWLERPIFGKVRYMNFNGAKSKFDVDTYIHWTRSL